uniref:Uncharacterized protein n=1 Tax=Sphenodon punctatus TaxID=8508 RepID=A0A8D0G5F2_SPHPU
MNPFSFMLLLLFLFRVQFGEPVKKHFPLQRPWHTGTGVCPGRSCTESSLLERVRPARSRVISVPQGAVLVEREKDPSTYNWNSFGLRYGKRHVDAMKAKVKIWS